jgi:hypothetical protein
MFFAESHFFCQWVEIFFFLHIHLEMSSSAFMAPVAANESWLDSDPNVFTYPDLCKLVGLNPNYRDIKSSHLNEVRKKILLKHHPDKSHLPNAQQYFIFYKACLDVLANKIQAMEDLAMAGVPSGISYSRASSHHHPPPPPSSSYAPRQAPPPPSTSSYANNRPAPPPPNTAYAYRPAAARPASKHAGYGYSKEVPSMQHPVPPTPDSPPSSPPPPPSYSAPKSKYFDQTQDSYSAPLPSDFEQFMARARAEEAKKNAAAYTYESQEQTGQRFSNASNRKNASTEHIHQYFSDKYDERRQNYRNPTAAMAEDFQQAFGHYSQHSGQGKKFNNDLFEDMKSKLGGGGSGGGPKKIKPMSLLSGSSSSRLDYAQSFYGDDDNDGSLWTNKRGVGSNLHDAHNPYKNLSNMGSAPAPRFQGSFQEYNNLRSSENLDAHRTSQEYQERMQYEREEERRQRNQQRLYRMYS